MKRGVIAFIFSVFLLKVGLGQDKAVVTTGAEEVTYQTIAGFGGFGAKKVWWDNPPYFDNDFIDLVVDDLGSEIIRTQLYWDFEPTNDNDDYATVNLAGFNYGPGSDNGKQFDYLRALKNKGIRKIISTVWTPPVWMKINTDNGLASFCNGQCGGQLNPDYYDEFAEYLTTYVKVLKEETGIDLYALSLQNELRFANPFESCVYSPESYRTLLNVVRNRFIRENLPTRIFGPEDMGRAEWNDEWFASVLEADEQTRDHVDIWAVHSYIDGVAPDYGSADGWTHIYNEVHDYNIPLWMTETSGYPQSWEGAFNLAKSIYLALKFGKVSAWVYWSLNGEPGSEFSLFDDAHHTKNSLVSKQFYRFIDPGAIQIKCETADPEILPIVFKNPGQGTLSVILINNGSTEKTVDLDIGPLPDSMKVNRTSVTEDFKPVSPPTGKQVYLPPESVTSIIGYGPKSPDINEIETQFINIGEHLEVELSGISDGDASGLTITAHSSNEDQLSVENIEFDGSLSTGKLVLNSAGNEPGKVRITLILQNNYVQTAAGFGFNEKQVSFDVFIRYGPSGLKGSVDPPVNLYPNPSDGLLCIELPGHSFSHGTVYNMTGEETGNFNVSPEQGKIWYTTSGLRRGLYTIFLTGKSGIYHGKFLVE